MRGPHAGAGADTRTRTRTSAWSCICLYVCALPLCCAVPCHVMPHLSYPLHPPSALSCPAAPPTCRMPYVPGHRETSSTAKLPGRLSEGGGGRRACRRLWRAGRWELPWAWEADRAVAGRQQVALGDGRQFRVEVGGPMGG